MPFLPDWAPNLHPAIVHFPIALLFAAVLVDFLGLIFKGRISWNTTAVTLFVLGAFGALAAYLTGDEAAEDMTIPQWAEHTLTEHADLALWTVWFFGIYAVLRLAALGFNRERKTVPSLVLFVIALGGLVLLFETAEHGAQMVFKHGVGVQRVMQSEAAMATPASDGLVALENGGWAWHPAEADAWKSKVRWLDGDSSDVAPSIVEVDSARGAVLSLTTNGTPVFFVFDGDLGDLEAALAVNLDGFQGHFEVVHHVKDAQNYHFVDLTGTEVRLGTVEGGDEHQMDGDEWTASGWQTYRVVADGRHFRAKAGDKIIGHGHGTPPEPGHAGLRLDGTGTVWLDFMTAAPLGAAEDDEHADADRDEDHEHADADHDEDHEPADSDQGDHKY